MTDWNDLSLKLHSLVLFRGLLAQKPMQALLALLEAVSAQDTHTLVDRYAAFSSALFQHSTCLTTYIRGIMLDDVNIYVQTAGQGGSIPPLLEECLQNELAMLQEVAALTSARVKRVIPYEGFLPDWQTKEEDLAAIYKSYVAAIPAKGYGVYARHHMFTLKNGSPLPVQHPDDIRLVDLRGYSHERQSIVQNTLALLDGKPAANALLYGDSGTGKSSTIKAIANEYHPRGLRLLEIKKSQLQHIPAVIDLLSGNPLKFILFIDDLAFGHDDDNYSTLKATLEGSVLARAGNVAIYATSNRRHLVRESFSDRAGDDVHAGETLQQLISLSDRFGLAVAFLTPKKEEYLQIVAHIADIYAVALPKEELYRQAEVYALQKGGRSPRIARQFIEHLAAAAN